MKRGIFVFLDAASLVLFGVHIGLVVLSGRSTYRHPNSFGIRASLILFLVIPFCYLLISISEVGLSLSTRVLSPSVPGDLCSLHIVKVPCQRSINLIDTGFFFYWFQG